MSEIVGVNANTQIIDPRTGYLTRDGFLLFQTFVQATNGAGASVTLDNIQTLTNKTIDGDQNTLRDIDTNSLKSRSGDGNTVATVATVGETGQLAVWVDGDLGGAPEPYPTTSEADGAYLSRSGAVAASGPIRLASFTVATAATDANPASYPHGLIYVSNETGGGTVAFSDGTNWRRVQDRAVIS